MRNIKFEKEPSMDVTLRIALNSINRMGKACKALHSFQ